MIRIDATPRWNTERLSSLFVENSKKNTNFSEHRAFQFYFGTIVPKKSYEMTDSLVETYKKYTVVQPGDIMINGLNLNYDFVTQRVAMVTEKGIITSAYISLRPRMDMNISYYCYMLKTVDAKKMFHGLGTGIRLTLSFKDIRNLQLPIPPRSEQDQIVRFLDWKVSEINKLIGSKRKQISLIQEYRTTMINDAVTHGIRDTRLKQSELKWLPQIPENWETIPAKALFDHIVEFRHEQDEMLAATQKYGMIAQKEYMALEGRRIVLANDNLDKWLHVEPGDFIISLRSFQGGLEVCTAPGCVTWHYVVLRPRGNVYVPYFRWLFKSASYIGALQRTSDFIRDGQDLRFSNFIKVRLLLVPLEEQREIAEFLEKKIPLFDVAEKKISDEIAALHELKARLISDVVTGKIDVRGAIVPDFEFITEEAELEEESDETIDTDGQED